MSQLLQIQIAAKVISTWYFLFGMHYTSVTENAEPRPRRMNRGQGGAISQLENIGKKIRPELEKQRPSRGLQGMPDTISNNPMAPIPAKRGRPKVSHYFMPC